MKVYITARFKGAENKQHIETLCAAVKAAGMTDFSFIRDVEQYKPLDGAKELWQRTYDELGACDALLIDVSDHPTGGRIAEAGMAFALRKPVIVTKKSGVRHKKLFDGIAATVIEYDDYHDLTAKLKAYDHSRTLTVTDKSVVLAMFLTLGVLIGGILAQFFLPLGIVGALLYWLLVRRAVPQLKAYDRIVVFVPLVVLWITGIVYLRSVDPALTIGWAIGYWVVALFVLIRSKFSL